MMFWLLKTTTIRYIKQENKIGNGK